MPREAETAKSSFDWKLFHVVLSKEGICGWTGKSSALTLFLLLPSSSSESANVRFDSRDESLTSSSLMICYN